MTGVSNLLASCGGAVLVGQELPIVPREICSRLSDPKVGVRQPPRSLTTKPDHNRIRHEPILADPPWLQAQVSDGIRQSACKGGGRTRRTCGCTGQEFCGLLRDAMKEREAPLLHGIKTLWIKIF
jgi:hypothetical protein